jgi:hypothetical protein
MGVRKRTPKTRLYEQEPSAPTSGWGEGFCDYDRHAAPGTLTSIFWLRGGGGDLGGGGGSGVVSGAAAALFSIHAASPPAGS